MRHILWKNYIREGSGSQQCRQCW